MADTTPRARCPSPLATVLLLVLADSVAAEALGEASIAAVSVGAGEVVDSEEIAGLADAVALAIKTAHRPTAPQQVLAGRAVVGAVVGEVTAEEDTMIVVALETPISNHCLHGEVDDTTTETETVIATTTAARSDHTKEAATTTRDKDGDTRLTLHTREQDGKTSP